MFDFGIIRFGTGGMDMSYFYYKASAETEKIIGKELRRIRI